MIPEMAGPRAYIAGAGLISAIGSAPVDLAEALRGDAKGFAPLALFAAPQDPPLLVGQVHLPEAARRDLPRTHALAIYAAAQALGKDTSPLDAIIVGTTTGGILTTEELLKADQRESGPYRYHMAGTVAFELAERFGCTGPVITVTTACSSGASAIRIGLALIRAGKARRVLAGGADSLCRLTYHGFHALQLIDPAGCRPFDQKRRGMTVAEGAAMLLLTADKPLSCMAEVLGGGLSCDAYHPSTPHPQGDGALAAMRAALIDAGLGPQDIGYINLHGTGTIDNDRAEALAVARLCGAPGPKVSSIKGATGHSLAAAGAIEAVMAAGCINGQPLPASHNLTRIDPALPLDYLTQSLAQPVDAILSNSFGFGGNNAALVISRPDHFPAPRRAPQPCCCTLIASACITGAGHTTESLRAAQNGQPLAGVLAIAALSRDLPARAVRRLKRLARMALSLAGALQPAAKAEALFFGTGLGPLSETHDFLSALYRSDGRFASPTDFVGSVHNAPAGHVAIQLKSTGPNITCSGGDYAFEQALFTALLLGPETKTPFLVMAADEAHPVLSPRLYPLAAPDAPLADGGGALLLEFGSQPGEITLSMPLFRWQSDDAPMPEPGPDMTGLVDSDTAFVLYSIPPSCREKGLKQLSRWQAQSAYQGPLIDLRALLGQYPTAPAAALALASRWLLEGRLPALAGYPARSLAAPSRALVLSFGEMISAVEIKNR